MANVIVTATQVRPLPGYEFALVYAGEAMAVGNVVQIAGDGDAEMANNSSAAGVAGTLGIVVAGERANTAGTIASGERITVLLRGRVYLGESANMDETKVYFAGATDGVISDVPGQYFRAIGTPIEPRVLYFNPVTTSPGS